MKLLNIAWQFDTTYSIIAYTYNAMIHLNRILDMWLLLKDHIIVITEVKMVVVVGRMEREKEEVKGESL